MDCKLEPLSWDEFEKRYRFAWDNGWVFGTAFTELYLDYLDSWRWFLEHLDKVVYHVQKNNLENIKILIGEAPPIWKGTNLSEERTYFYNHLHDKGKQPWLNEPFKYFNKIDYPGEWVNNKYSGFLTKKKEKLNYLASKGIILIDVFPFPIIQDTNNRKKIDAKKEKTSFSSHVEEYLINHLKKLLDYLKCRTDNDQLAFECAFMAPEYTSLQLMYDPNIIDPLKDLNLLPLKGFSVAKISGIKFDIKLTKGLIPLKKGKSKSNKMSYFLFKLNGRIEKISENELENIPILISGQSPNFNRFFNSTTNKLKKKFSL